MTGINSPGVVLFAALPVLAAIGLVYLFADGMERISRARAELDEPVDYWPATDADTPLRPDLEAHIRDALALANTRWTALDDLQARRELRKHTHH